MLEAVRAGLRLAHVAEWYISEDLAAARLVRVLHDWTPPFPGLAAPTGQWLRRTSIVLAVYQELEPWVDRTELVVVLRDAMIEPFKEKMSDYLLSRFGISQDAPQEAFARIAEISRHAGRSDSAKHLCTSVQDADRAFTNIHRCFFNDFFRMNGSPELISIFCALDSVWVEALHAGNYEVRFARPIMLSQGADAGRFQFSRGLASSVDAPKSPRSQ